MEIKSAAQRTFANEYVFNLVPARRNGLVASLSDNSLRVLPFELEQFEQLKACTDYKNAHDNTITGLQPIDPHTVGSSSLDGTIKIWDLRIGNKSPSQTFKNQQNTPFTCLDVFQGKLAAGTELVEQDAGVILWDMRTPNTPLVEYMDAHNEDVTQVQFHREEPNGLLSAAQDGYVHVYNTSILDMDEAIYQTINHNTAIQKAGFLPNRHVFAKSNMETMSIYSIPDPDSEQEDPKPRDFGDLREKWNCEYVADILEGGIIAAGSNNKQEFSLLNWNSETDQTTPICSLTGAHGEEVVRAVYLDAINQCIYTGGEDGCVKVWKPTDPLNIETGEWKQVKSKKKKDKKDKKKKKKSSSKHRYEPY